MITKEKTIAQCVTENFKTAKVFQKYGLDFCCGGNTPVEDACKKANIDFNDLNAELEEVTKVISNEENYAEYDLNRLIDHILDTYHVYIREASPIIKARLEKLARVHGQNHPELIKTNEVFQKMAIELEAHMQKEENILFPYIRVLASDSEVRTPSCFGTVQNPIRMMNYEHEVAGDDMKEIHKLTNGYEVPEDGCNTYRVGFQELQEFEDKLFEHVHLENNILFPKAIELE
jgi:regulator of cell morphogenesis and NO signaling